MAQNTAEAQYQVPHRGEIRVRFKDSTMLLCRLFNCGVGLLSAAAPSWAEMACIADAADWRTSRILAQVRGGTLGK